MIEMFDHVEPVIPNFINKIKEPEHVADLFRRAADYIELGMKADSFYKEIEEEIIIKNIALDIINKHGLGDELNEKCSQDRRLKWN